jgi:membrane protease YdiL (CAAX protease family)
MKDITPEIVPDWEYREAVKNKMEVLSYAKLSNTKNKKINIASKWLFSFFWDGENIFQKPKIRFWKLIFLLCIFFLVAISCLFLYRLYLADILLLLQY